MMTHHLCEVSASLSVWPDRQGRLLWNHLTYKLTAFTPLKRHHPFPSSYREMSDPPSQVSLTLGTKLPNWGLTPSQDVYVLRDAHASGLAAAGFPSAGAHLNAQISLLARAPSHGGLAVGQRGGSWRCWGTETEGYKDEL